MLTAMNWLTTLAFAVLLLSVQYDAAESVSFSRSPWANPAKANSLMNCLITRIANSNVLPQQEKEDLESIMDTLMSAIKGANAKGRSSAAQLQAINMAVASSLAEIVVAEDVGNQASMAVKTQALSGALEQCFQAVMGTVDRKFISEIRDLISMFARQAASETNEIEDQGGFNAAGSSGSAQYQATSQTFQGSSQTTGAFSAYQGGAFSGAQVSQPSTPGYPGGAGPYGGGAPLGGLGGQGGLGPISGAQSALISRIANALSNSSTLRAVLRSGVSQNTASSVVQRTVQTLASTLGIDGSSLSRIALQAISQVPQGSDTNAYAQALSTALVTGGVLNSSNIDTSGSQVLSALLNGVSNAAQSFGINVDTGSVQSDIRSSTGFLSTSSSSTSFSQSTSAAGASSTTGYTGAGISTPGYPGGAGPYGGGGPLGGLGGQGGFGPISGAQIGSTGISTGVSLRSALNSPNGLRSGSAITRISQLTSSLRNAVGPNGVDANALARSLQASVSNLQSSGMSSSDAKVEVLLETIVGLLQLLSNTEIRGVNMATASSIANSAARSFEACLA